MNNARHGKECVVLLHGLGRSAWSMQRLAHFFRARGYVVWCKTYPSRRHAVEVLAEKVFADLLADKRVKRCDKVHFVTHSLGGILLRQWFQGGTHNEAMGQVGDSFCRVGRVVMLGTPNHGSEVTDFFRHWPLYQWLTGPAGGQLGTKAEDVPKMLKPIDLEIGIIAGTRSADPWFKPLFNGKHDGKVSVSSTRLAEMADFVALPVGHTLMMWNKDVIEQTSNFIQTGRFSSQI